MIRSRQNRRIKDMWRARRCKGDAALLEGPYLLRAALRAGIGVEAILATPEFVQGSGGRRLAPELPLSPTLVQASLLEELADSDSPRGVVALARLPRSGVSALPCRPGVYLYADGLQDPGNLGALARSAEAAGAVALALGPGSVHANHPRALRASAGSLLRLSVALGVSAQELDRHLEEIRPLWVALTPRGGENLYETELPETVVVLLGAEGGGLSPSLGARAELQVTVPLERPVESLNVAVAGALVLFELRRRARYQRPVGIPERSTSVE